MQAGQCHRVAQQRRRTGGIRGRPHCVAIAPFSLKALLAVELNCRFGLKRSVETKRKQSITTLRGGFHGGVEVKPV